MLPLALESPVFFVVWILALLLAITVHEFAHAFAADKLGDPTPRIQGRLTLNPLAHLDPVGTLMLLLFKFGWGKPVQFDPYNLQNPRRDAAIISFAGPLSNLILAGLLAIPINLGFIPNLLIPFVLLNIVLAIFNLVPVHPLDGGKILVGLLPEDQSEDVDLFLRKYGLFIVLGLLLPIWGGVSPLVAIISPVVNFLTKILLSGVSYI